MPAASYRAKFVGVEPVEANQFGPGLRWVFEVAAGQHTGTRVSRTTGAVPTLKNACGKFLMAVSGKNAVGETVDLTTLVGKVYLIIVVQRPEGGTSLDSVSVLPAE
ncbi:hypothetical protein [Frigoriglobus tundricola]|uniref:hypothetical protein n=1 Tax=Frigoriglobus tundricola TaxID=2774151 RepID=UPI00148E969C|nr:hypothetical protein [Frigoriglobus tundricola]